MKRQGIISIMFVLLVFLSITYTPTAVHASTPALDGSPCSSSSTTKTVSCTISSTTNSGDLVIVMGVFVGSSPSAGNASCTGTGGAGCPNTMSSRTSSVDSASPKTLVEEFYGTASKKLKSADFTATAGGTVSYAYIVAFAVSGAAASPFPTAAVSASGTSSTPSVSITTSTTDIMVIGLEGDQSTTAESAGIGFTLINGAYTNGFSASSSTEYELSTSGCASSCTVDFANTATNWVIIADAISSSTSVPDLPFGPLPLLALVPVLYALSGKSKGHKGRLAEGRPAFEEVNPS